jgi:proteasome lid subunit RPN8/RPN11
MSKESYYEKPITVELLKARDACDNVLEEEGGVIIKKDDSYEFIKLTNVYAGTATAIGLYEADSKEFSKKVITRMNDGWRLCASFHTHPSFSANPSSLDRSTLFQGFKVNFIYSPIKQQFSCSVWLSDILTILYADEQQLEKEVNYVK